MQTNTRLHTDLYMCLYTFSRTRLKLPRCMRQLIGPINSSLLTITLYSSVKQHKIFSPFCDVIIDFDCMLVSVTAFHLKRQCSAVIDSGLQAALNHCTALYGSLQSVTIPDTVGIQFSFLLKMSTSMLETCRGIQCNRCD